jgi:hypothetical protein
MFDLSLFSDVVLKSDKCEGCGETPDYADRCGCDY